MHLSKESVQNAKSWIRILIFFIFLLLAYKILDFLAKEYVANSINVPDTVAQYIVDRSIDRIQDIVLIEASQIGVPTQQLQKEASEAIRYSHEKNHLIRKLERHISVKSCNLTVDHSGSCIVSIHQKGKSEEHRVLFIKGNVQKIQ